MKVIELIGGEVFAVKSFSIETKADGENRSAVVSTETLDSQGDIIRQGPNEKGQGWILNRFNKSPLLLWQHNIWDPNLSGPETRAHVRDVEPFGPSLWLDPLTFDMDDPHAASIGGKVDRKVLTESSVGFIGKVSAPIEGGRGREFFEQELFEVSFANRGANPDTETMVKTALAAGVDIITRKVETGGDAESAELVEEISDLTQRIRTVENLLKALTGDEAEVKAKDLVTVDQSLQKAAVTLAERLERIGISHN